MKGKRRRREEGFLEDFPSAGARDIADKAIDGLPLELSMGEYIDRWVAAYIEAGGRTRWVKEVGP